MAPAGLTHRRLTASFQNAPSGWLVAANAQRGQVHETPRGSSVMACVRIGRRLDRSLAKRGETIFIVFGKAF
jgi:hypothetical protein